MTNSRTLRPYPCLNGNWVIKGGSSARLVLHLPVILLLAFGWKLTREGLQGKISELRFHLTLRPGFLTCFLNSNLPKDAFKQYLIWPPHASHVVGRKKLLQNCLVVTNLAVISFSKILINNLFGNQDISRFMVVFIPLDS